MQLQVIEVAIGLFAGFFVVAVVASAIVEIVSSWFRKRSKDLWVVVDKMLADNNANALDLTKTSVYQAMVAGSRRKRDVGTDVRAPSYMSARSFADAVIEALIRTKGANEDLNAVVAKLAPGPLKARLETLRIEVDDDLLSIKAGLEGWFDDAMDRLEGAYKRWSQWALVLAGIVVAALLNVSAVRVIDGLWDDAALRTAVANAAPNLTESSCPEGMPECGASDRIEQAIGDLEGLDLPVGWGPGWSDESGALWTWLGFLPTGFAVMLGAPFWFDLLSRLTGARQRRGVPPKAADDRASAVAESMSVSTSGTATTGRKKLADLF